MTRGLVVSQFHKCMDAPNYTLFSNTTSMRAWNKANPGNQVTALESPHNYILSGEAAAQDVQKTTQYYPRRRYRARSPT